jgi:hypothetical protein
MAALSHCRRRPSPRLRRLVVAIVTAFALLPAPDLSAGAQASPRSPDYVIKAAYLYNFALFVEWPPDAFVSPDAPLVIGIVGSDPFGWALQRIVDGKRINNHRIGIERVQSVQDARRCHILFVGADETARLAEFAARLGGASVLIVGEADDVIKEGGAVSFTVQDNKVAYDINLHAARRARLTISSKLLNLARIVRG